MMSFQLDHECVEEAALLSLQDVASAKQLCHYPHQMRHFPVETRPQTPLKAEIRHQPRPHVQGNSRCNYYYYFGSLSLCPP